MKELINNPILKKIANQVVSPMTSQNISVSAGAVISYNADNNTLALTCAVNGASRAYQTVPIIFSPSIKTIYTKGDCVALIFLFSDQDYPIVVGKIDEAYLENSKYQIDSTLINLP